MPYLTAEALPGVDVISRQLRIPNDLNFLAAVNGALRELTFSYNWEQHGARTPEQCAQRALDMFFEYLDSGWMIGTILPYVTSAPPSNMLPCDGSTYNRVDYTLLYALIDPAYHVDPDTFMVPDLRDKFLLAAGTTYAAGDEGGAATVSLTEAQNGPHSHTTQPHSHTNTPHSHTEGNAIASTASPPVPPAIIPSAIPGVGVTGLSGVVIDAATVVVDSSGSGEAHENMPPYRAVKYGIVAN